MAAIGRLDVPVERADRVEERRRVRVGGALEHRRGTAALDEPARVHDVDLVAEGGREAEVVGDQDHPHPALVDDAAQHLHDARLRRDVERRRRFVGDEHVRVGEMAIAIMTRWRMPPENSCG